MKFDLEALKAPCVYCDRDVMPPMNVPHAADCPSNTGLFPVLLRDLEPHGMGCWVAEIVCLDCKWVSADSGGEDA